MLSDLMEQAFNNLTEHGHYLDGRNVSPGGTQQDPSTCLLIAMNRVDGEWDQRGVFDGLACLERYLREAGAVIERRYNITTWSDTTPDEEFFLTLKKAIVIARAAEEGESD